MGSLFSLIKELSILSTKGKDQEIDDLCFDSRQAKIGSLFFAIPGTQVDGHQFLERRKYPQSWNRHVQAGRQFRHRHLSEAEWRLPIFTGKCKRRQLIHELF